MAEFNMNRLRLAVAALCSALTTSVLAEVQTVDRAAKGQSGKDIRVGVYLNVQPDCKSGPLPTIRLTAPPEHGTVIVKKGNVTATNYKQCLALQVSAFVAIYKAQPNCTGVDVLSLEVAYPGGKTETQRITVTVGISSPGQGI